MKNTHVIIAGAGPAGLTLALVLQQRNIEFTLLDAASEQLLCSDVGGGYDLGGNAVKIFGKFELDQALTSAGTRLDTIRIYANSGKLAKEIRIPAAVEMVSVKRSTLQNLLLDKLMPCNIRFNARVVEVAESDANVTVTLQNGEEIIGDLLIGADGVHSAVRAAVFADGEPDHVGVNCVWGRTRWDSLPAVYRDQLDGGYMMMGSGQTFLAGRMEDQLIWSTFWKANAFIASDNRCVATKKAIARLGKWNTRISEIVNLADEVTISETGIYDRPAATTWHKGKVLLIGDAAHPMTPFLGAGANAAITDGFLLGQLIDGLHSHDEVFSFFEKRRKKPVENIVKSARSVCDYSLSDSKWKNALMLYGTSLIPSSLMVKMMLSADKVNDVAFYQANTVYPDRSSESFQHA